MSGGVSKVLRSLAMTLTIDWLQGVMPEKEWAKLTPKFVKAAQDNQDIYVYGNGTRRVSAYTTKWFYKQLKKAHVKGNSPYHAASLVRRQVEKASKSTA